MVILCDFGDAPDGVSSIGLGKPPSSRDGLAFEVIAGGVPGKIIAGFPHVLNAGPSAPRSWQLRISPRCDSG